MSPIFLYILVINSFTFLIFGLDKGLAVWGRSRVSENALLFLTLIGGTAGGMLAMPIFRHKVSKTSFLLKFLSVLVLQILAILFSKFHF